MGLEDDQEEEARSRSRKGLAGAGCIMERIDMTQTGSAV